jgi:hypothetical protein
MIKSNVIILFWMHFFQGRQSTVKYLEVNEIKPKNSGFRSLYLGLVPDLDRRPHIALHLHQKCQATRPVGRRPNNGSI